jgi:hypothetical protein
MPSKIKTQICVRFLITAAVNSPVVLGRIGAPRAGPAAAADRVEPRAQQGEGGLIRGRNPVLQYVGDQRRAAAFGNLDDKVSRAVVAAAAAGCPQMNPQRLRPQTSLGPAQHTVDDLLTANG